MTYQQMNLFLLACQSNEVEAMKQMASSVGMGFSGSDAKTELVLNKQKLSAYRWLEEQLYRKNK